MKKTLLLALLFSISPSIKASSDDTDNGYFLANCMKVTMDSLAIMSTLVAKKIHKNIPEKHASLENWQKLPARLANSKDINQQRQLIRDAKASLLSNYSFSSLVKRNLETFGENLNQPPTTSAQVNDFFNNFKENETYTTAHKEAYEALRTKKALRNAFAGGGSAWLLYSLKNNFQRGQYFYSPQ